MKTLNQFFNEKKDILPVGYRTFKRRLLTDDVINDLKKNKIILVLGSDKRKIIKILNEKAFLNYFFGVEQ